MSERIKVKEAQRRLMVIWLIGAAVTLLLLIAQTVGGKFGTEAAKAFSWFMPNVLPTLLLMVGADLAEKATDQPPTADRFAFTVSLSLSVAYLGLLLGTVLVQPASGMTPFEMMRTSDLWLGPVQGLVGLSLGRFFVSRKPD